jgi:signal peptidase II
MKGYLYFCVLFFVGLSLLFVDFYSKAYIFSFLSYDIPIFRDFFGVDFSLTLAMNRGAAWGAFANLQHLILVLRIGVIIFMLFYLFFMSKERSKEIPLLMIVTGALGNVIDYFLYGSVVDFLKFNLWGYNFPIFNFADTLITCGVFSFFLISYLGKKGSKAVVKGDA